MIRNTYRFHGLKADRWRGVDRVHGYLSIGPGPETQAYLALDRDTFARLIADLGLDPAPLLPPPAPHGEREDREPERHREIAGSQGH